MTKKFAIVLALFLIAVVCSAGCIDPETPVDPIVPVDPVVPVDPETPVEPELPVEEYSVMFMLNYDDAGAYTAETVKAGDTVSRPASPSRSGYTFTGWFTAADGGVAYDFTLAVNSDVMLYAQWSKKKSSGGGHSHDWDVVTEPATCGADGLKTSTCSKCGETKTEVLLATGEHSYTNIITSVTCTEDEVSSCSVCGASNPNPIQAKGHNPVENDDNGKLTAKCSVCGEEYKAKLVPNNGENPKYYLEVKDAIGDANAGYTLNLTADMTERVSLDKAVVISTHKHKVNLSYTNIDDIKILKDGCNINDVDVTQNDEAVSFIVTDSIYLEIPDKWDGTIDTSWYNEQDTEFTLTTAEQFAGLTELVDGGNTFEGKTIKLEKGMDLYKEDASGNPICFDPIGSYRNNNEFKGTFDGQGYTISNLNQNTWALDNGYYYEDLGMGLFGKLRDATIKNLNIDGAEISGESGMCGVVAAASYGESTFENIKVSNSNCADYQYYAGGIVGWASGTQKFIGCEVDSSNNIAAQWGDFNNCIGGVIGGAGSSADIIMKDCIVACRIDAYNDVTSAYEWYSYRNAGMLIGNTGNTKVVEGITYADAPQLTCENVTVVYDEWANYHYCEFGAMGYPYVRCEAGVSNAVYSNPRYGHPTDANGNEVVDDNHVHNDGEDHDLLIVFDQLYGGSSGDRYCTYGTATHDGVTVVYNNK